MKNGWNKYDKTNMYLNSIASFHVVYDNKKYLHSYAFENLWIKSPYAHVGNNVIVHT